MSGIRKFVDTNVLLYLASAENLKAETAEKVVVSGGFISVQVLNEFVAVARRKWAFSLTEIGELLLPIRHNFQINPLTLACHDHALRLAERYKLPIYDALIVASAIRARCSVLLTEDFQHGQVFESSLVISNPFHRGS